MRAPYVPTRMLRDPAWCSWCSCIFLLDGGAVLRLQGDTLSLVAGCLQEDEGEGVNGRGADARFSCARFVTSDHNGRLYLADCTRLCRVQLPAAWKVETAPAAAATAPAATAAPTAATGGNRAAEAEADGAEEEVDVEEQLYEAHVTTLLVADSDVTGLAFIPSSAECSGPSDGSDGSPCSGGGGGAGCLIYATDTAIYRLTLSGDAVADAAAVPELLAGRSDEEGTADSSASGATARFTRISGLCVDAGGAVFLADQLEDGETTALRRVAPNGTVTTVVGAGGLDGQLSWPTIIPGSGYLVLCSFSQRALLLLDLGLTPPAWAAAGSCGSGAAAAAAAAAAAHDAVFAVGPLKRTLAADLGALLEAQPDCIADIVIVVSGRHFAAHRAVLAARCDYFRQRLTGEFSDASAAQITLPDADADAFALLLRWIYTGDLEGAMPTDGAALHAVAELADRLLLPELCRTAQAQVLAGVSAETVVGALLWAERLSGGEGSTFGELLGRLKAWYLGHQVEVMEAAAAEVKRLMVESPDLAFELSMATARQARRGA